jgi:2-polyprenyl-3-methyl-5-hydroxy-6-metoxy-1,4-benzoquinol methylase
LTRILLGKAKAKPDFVVRKIFHDLTYELARELDNCQSVLDLGCGPSSPIKSPSLNFYSVGIAVFEPSIQESKRKGIHNEYFLMNLLDIDEKFQQNSFDAVVAFDLIGHIEKKEEIRLIGMMEKIAKKKVILSALNGFLAQKMYGGNIWQIHKSGWETKEMRERGYRVIGINGWKRLRARAKQS